MFKLAIYDLIQEPPLSRDERLATQLREAARSAASDVAEGFGRFDPVDFARFVKMARASVIECKNHLVDAVDARYISEETRKEHVAQADAALAEMSGLIDYLQSPEAKRNAERIRQARFERRRRRNSEPGTQNSEPGTQNLERGTVNSERGTVNSERGTVNSEHGTRNQEPGTRTENTNQEHGTRNLERKDY